MYTPSFGLLTFDITKFQKLFFSPRLIRHGNYKTGHILANFTDRDLVWTKKSFEFSAEHFSIFGVNESISYGI